jgi:hypothetical protein
MAQQQGDEWCRLWSNRLSTPLTKIADGCGLSSDRAESSTRWNRIIDQPADKEGFTLAIPKPMPAVRIEHVEKAQA